MWTFGVFWNQLRGAVRIGVYRGTSLIRNHPPPYDPPKTLDIGLREGPGGLHFLVSEVSLEGV